MTATAIAPAVELWVRRHASSEGTRVENWLAELREMRGRIAYELGRRPWFRKDDGSFEDADALDLAAYHIIARSQGRAVGCARVVLLREAQSSIVSSIVSEKRFERLLGDLGTTREQTCECSRWIVAPEHRGELGRRIVAATWAVCHRLSAQVAFVLAGTHQKQDLALIRMGARAVPALPLFPSKAFDDDLRLLYFDVIHPPPAMERRIIEAEALSNSESSRRWH
jgi:hypothetical protein